jgi:hypothetical protein
MNWKNILKRNYRQYSLSILAFFFALTLFGQEYPKAIIIDSDTTICFTLPQSKELAKRNELLKKYVLDLKDCDSSVVLYQQKVDNRGDKIAALENIIENKDSIISNSDKIIGLHEQTISGLNKQVKRQKRLKIAAFSAAGVLLIALIVK